MPVLRYIANSADPNQPPQNAASDLGLHCLLTVISIQKIIKVKTFIRNPQNYKWTHPNDKEGQVHWSKRLKGY